jgi:hypothetical protein
MVPVDELLGRRARLQDRRHRQDPPLDFADARPR